MRQPVKSIRKGISQAAAYFFHPLQVARLSRTPVAIGGTAALIILAFVLLFYPSGIFGLLAAILAWVGGLILGASAVRTVLLERRVETLQADLDVAELELNKRLNSEEQSLLEKVRNKKSGMSS